MTLWDDKIGSKLTKSQSDAWRWLAFNCVADCIDEKKIRMFVRQIVPEIIGEECDYAENSGMRYSPEQFAEIVSDKINKEVELLINNALNKKKKYSKVLANAAEIIKLRKQGLTYEEIKEKTGVNIRSIGDIVRKNRTPKRSIK